MEGLTGLTCSTVPSPSFRPFPSLPCPFFPISLVLFVFGTGAINTMESLPPTPGVPPPSSPMANRNSELPEPSSVTFARELAGRPGRPVGRWAPPGLQTNGIDVSVPRKRIQYPDSSHTPELCLFLLPIELHCKHFITRLDLRNAHLLTIRPSYEAILLAPGENKIDVDIDTRKFSKLQLCTRNTPKLTVNHQVSPPLQSSLSTRKTTPSPTCSAPVC